MKPKCRVESEFIYGNSQKKTGSMVIGLRNNSKNDSNSLEVRFTGGTHPVYLYNSPLQAASSNLDETNPLIAMERPGLFKSDDLLVLNQSYLSIDFEGDKCIGVLEYLGKRLIFFAANNELSDGKTGSQFKGIALTENSSAVSFIGVELEASSTVKVLVRGGGFTNMVWKFKTPTKFDSICDDYCPEGLKWQEGFCIEVHQYEKERVVEKNVDALSRRMEPSHRDIRNLDPPGLTLVEIFGSDRELLYMLDMTKYEINYLDLEVTYSGLISLYYVVWLESDGKFGVSEYTDASLQKTGYDAKSGKTAMARWSGGVQSEI
jgi:hypothetical protein